MERKQRQAAATDVSAGAVESSVDEYESIVCPTCLTANRSRTRRSWANGVKIAISVPLAAIPVADLFVWLLVRLERECNVCGARFFNRRRSRKDAPVCWRCGYLLTGLSSLVCPECGTRVPKRYRDEEAPGESTHP